MTAPRVPREGSGCAELLLAIGLCAMILGAALGFAIVVVR